MYNTFCPKLSNRIFLTNINNSNDIEYKPCCWFEKSFSFETQQDLDDIRNDLNKIDDWTPECQKCKLDEDAGLESFRTESGFLKRVKPDDLSLELQLNQECNAACITCGPWSSTTWTKYNEKNQGRSTKINIKQDFTSRVDKIKQAVDFSKVKHVTVAGGEPLLDTTHIDILSSIPDDLKNTVVIDIITNGSVKLTDSLKEFYKKFKKVNFVFSLDGIQQTFEYHRWPLKWHQVESNFENFMSLSHTYWNFDISITTTLTPLNIFYIDNLDIWKTQMERKYSKLIFLKLAGANGVMGLSALSPQMRKLLHSKFDNGHFLSKFIELEKFHVGTHIKFLKHIAYHDSKRNLNWQKVFSEIQDCIPLSKTMLFV